MALSLAVTAVPGHAQGEEPISYVGHGALFDSSGREIAPTVEFVTRAQDWYRRRLMAGLDVNRQVEFTAYERRLFEGFNLDGQAALVVRQRSLEWLIARAPRTAVMARMRGKLNAVRHALTRRLPHSDDPQARAGARREPFALDPRLEARLRLPEFNLAQTAFLITGNDGEDYNNQCATAGVPVPPPINVMDNVNGTTGWKILGLIPQSELFIVRSRPAEVRVFQSADGMCIALPRYYDDTLAVAYLDGVICLSSRPASNACFWDNQRNGVRFDIPAGTQVPIGFTTVPGGLYQAGGAELEGGSGGECTDCHAGENPYIIHPNADLGNGLLMGGLNSVLGLPTFAPNRYDPIVAASWPQNEFSHPESTVPGIDPVTGMQRCVNCHRQPSAGGLAGRFPHLSSELNNPSGYCKTVLRNAIAGTPSATPPIPSTMPTGAPGSLAANPGVIAFQDWCGVAATGDPSDRGDPHLTTTNGINYDFQAAGEFTALRNSSNGFELQTRQTPVLTSFTPGANGYTGLASCVSLNTAAAVRVGRRRISYQPSASLPARMQLRVDGRPVALPASGVNLGSGNRITQVSGGGVDISAQDGTRLIITPNYWASEGYWYLNIEVLDTTAREGTMGHIMAPDWLPFAPNGASFGGAPATLPARHVLLNRVFADAWRVTSATSLFDYAPGTSTATFTNRSWPPAPGSTCTALRGNPWPGGQPRRPVRPMNPEAAQRLCRPIQDRTAFANCVFDLVATGDAGMANAYLRTLRLRAAPPRRQSAIARP